MQPNSLARTAREPTSGDLAFNAKQPGPFHDFLRDLFAGGRDPEAYDLREAGYIAAHLPPRWTWTAESLDAVRDEIIGFSSDPSTACAFLDDRLSGPFAGWMSEHGGGFVSDLPGWCERMDMPMPDLARIATLKAVMIRLYDVACEARPVVLPSESLPAAWRRNVS